jgi:hypothetical protein
MNRRDFLRGATTTMLVLPFGTFLVHCTSDNEGSTTTTNPTVPPTDNTPPDAPPRVEGANVVYTSNQVQAHSHSFSVPSTALATPPPAGISGATTAAQLHSHLVAVSQADLQNVLMGQSVKIATSEVAGHIHTFTFVKVA